MKDYIPIFVALIMSAPAWLAWRQSRKNHELVNSRMTELLTLTKSSSRAEGVEEERLRER